MTTITQLSSAHRLLIARVTDLALDVSLAGRYYAHVSFTPSCWDYSVVVCPAGGSVTDPIYENNAYLNWRVGARAHPDNALPEMIATLEALLAESNMEVQPS